MAHTYATCTDTRNLPWTPAEKAIAHKAFDLVLLGELEEVVRQARERAAKIKEPSELWELERFLTQRRKDIDAKYDFRYSVLTEVFGNLIREGRLSEDDLSGIAEDKLAFIRRHAAR